MRNIIIIAFLALLAGVVACKKDNASDPVPVAKNEWWFADTVFKAGYTETDARFAYQISFRASGGAGLSHGLSLQFAARPAAGSYAVSDTAIAANEVRVTLENGEPPIYISAGPVATQVQTTIKEGKRTFTGTGIRVVRDTIPALADTLTVSFDLTEF